MDHSPSLVNPSDLKKEQRMALAVLDAQWSEAELGDDVRETGLIKRAVLPTGFTCFFSQKISRTDFFAGDGWKWSQSHGRVATIIRGHKVTLQKFSPKRLSATTVTTRGKVGPPIQVPSYKLWIMTLELPTPCYFVWAERGFTLSAEAKEVAKQLRSMSKEERRRFHQRVVYGRSQNVALPRAVTVA